MQGIDSSRHDAPTIRSYVRRQGRISKAQRRAWQQHAATYLLPDSAGSTEPLDAAGWAEVFGGQQAPLVVEIGSGYGEATAAMAAADAARHYIAFEVHYPGIGALLKRLAEGGIDNVRIVHADAVPAIARLLADGSVSAFNIFFPDPWRKKRHHKRRLISPPFLSLLLAKLALGGGVHFVTDWHPYAQAAAEVFAAAPALAAAPPPPRARTGYEARAQAASRAVHEFYFVKTG